MQSLYVLGTLKTACGQNLVRLFSQAIGKGDGELSGMPAAFSQVFLTPYLVIFLSESLTRSHFPSPWEGSSGKWLNLETDGTNLFKNSQYVIMNHVGLLN